MSGVMTAIAVVGAGTAAVQGHQSRKAMKKQGELLGNMQYYEDPDYRETQDYLKQFGLDLLEGDIPDYYKGIGESAGKELEDVIAMTTRDITQGAEEGLAKSGRLRGGSLAASIAQPVADASTKLRYADLERALQGKQFLMQEGRGITEGVRQAAQGEEDAQNAFNAMKTGALVDLEGMKGAQRVQETGQYGEALTSLISGFGSGEGGFFGEGGLFSKKATPNNISSADIDLFSSGRSATGAIRDRKPTFMNSGRDLLYG